MKKLLLVAILLIASCSTSTDPGKDPKPDLTTKSIVIPAELTGDKKVAWKNDSTYVVFLEDQMSFYQVTNGEASELPLINDMSDDRSMYYQIKQFGNQILAIVDVSHGVYIISDTVYGLEVPGIPKMVSNTFISEEGDIFAWGGTGVWKANLDSKYFSPFTSVFDYNVAGLFIYDSLGIISFRNELMLFNENQVLETYQNSDLGLAPVESSSMPIDWYGMVEQGILIIHDQQSVIFDPLARQFIPTTSTPNDGIVSFSDGDCKYSIHFDFEIWCDQGENSILFTPEEAAFPNAMIYAGKNSEGFWVSSGDSLILLDLDLAKSLARGGK